MNDMSRGPSPHFNVGRISRSTGANAVERAAYRHATRMEAEARGPTENFGAQAGALKHSEIMLPGDAPTWAAEAYGEAAFQAALDELLAEPLQQLDSPGRFAWARLSERLWNDIEHAEFSMNRKWRSAQLAWEINAALPRVLSDGGRILLLRDYATEAFRDHRTAVDCVIRDRGDGNPHAFLTLPTRTLGAEGWGGKDRKLRGPRWIRALRMAWQRHVNLALEREGRRERIDMRSLEDQGSMLESESYDRRIAANVEKAGGTSRERLRAEARRQLSQALIRKDPRHILADVQARFSCFTLPELLAAMADRLDVSPEALPPELVARLAGSPDLVPTGKTAPDGEPLHVTRELARQEQGPSGPQSPRRTT